MSIKCITIGIAINFPLGWNPAHLSSTEIGSASGHVSFESPVSVMVGWIGSEAVTLPGLLSSTGNVSLPSLDYDTGRATIYFGTCRILPMACTE